MNTPGASAPHSWRAGVAYGLMGLPLAFVALPLYVILPNHYARSLGVPLAALGLVLLATRLLDALVDPFIGRVVDRLLQRPAQALLAWAAAACAVLAAGFALLFFPLVSGPTAVLAASVPLLMLVYAAFSLLGVAHQTWAARLGGGAHAQSQWVAWREGLGLVGVVLAVVLSSLGGLAVLTGALVLALALGWWAWSHAPRPAALPLAGQAPQMLHWWQPLRNTLFVRLLAVFVLNGIASALPATLVLFFVQDRLQAPAALEPLFLGSYFVCAALSMPLWVRAVARWGLVHSWRAGMVLSVLVFAGAATLQAGDVGWFVGVCALSGLALGADLAVPSALLAGVVQRTVPGGGGQGAYFGWWNLATKLNLALAAGLALPLLATLGYAPGTRDAQALQALTLAYCIVPCVLKLLAAMLLHVFFGNRPAGQERL